MMSKSRVISESPLMAEGVLTTKLLLHGRYIRNGIIVKAIEDAYRPYLMQNKYPFTSLYFR